MLLVIFVLHDVVFFLGRLFSAFVIEVRDISFRGDENEERTWSPRLQWKLMRIHRRNQAMEQLWDKYGKT